MQDNSQISQLIDHLFRHESGKLISVLTRIFGSHHLELVEDVVQDTLLEALKVWTYNEVPKNPTAWIHTVAKNKALNIIKHEKYKQEYASEFTHFLKSEWTAIPLFEHMFSEQEIIDDQLRMMFSCCHPSISPDSQVALTLKTLCGFSIPEIARAFITSDDTINKRLIRARNRIRDSNIPFIIPDKKEELSQRLDAVLETIYLLFNEAYSASVGENLIRYDLCTEAIRLAELLIQHRELKGYSNIYALLALMYLNASRFPARQDDKGHIIRLPEQDRSLWNKTLMDKGFYYIVQITSDEKLSKYHILATISANHCSASDYGSTNWKNILSLYDHLLKLDNSPIVVLNRAVVVSKVNGIKSAIYELEQLKNETVFQSYHLFYTTLAELYIEDNSFDKAIQNLNKAIEFSNLESEKELLVRRLNFCKKNIS